MLQTHFLIVLSLSYKFIQMPREEEAGNTEKPMCENEDIGQETEMLSPYP